MWLDNRGGDGVVKRFVGSVWRVLEYIRRVWYLIKLELFVEWSKFVGIFW